MSQFAKADNDSQGSGLAAETVQFIDVVLDGGPAGLPARLRCQRVPARTDKIKVSFYGGYEHFERDADHAGVANAPVVFRWTLRTRIAE